MRKIILAVLFYGIISCAHRVSVALPQTYTLTENYSYSKTPTGQWIIITRVVNGQRSRDEAIRELRIGPAATEQLDMWIVTPVTK